jgi:hypothetical protein
MHLPEVSCGGLRRTQIGFGHDLQERHAGTVQVDARLSGEILVK